MKLRYAIPDFEYISKPINEVYSRNASDQICFLIAIERAKHIVSDRHDSNARVVDFYLKNGH